MRATVLATLLALPVLAGCATPDVAVPGETVPASAPDGVYPWGLTECRFIIANVRVDPEAVRALLPDGFDVATGDGLPLPVEVDAVAQTTMGVEAFSCKEGAGLDGPVRDLAYGSFYFSVIPPDAYRLADDEDAGYYYKLSVIVPDGPRRMLLADAGADVVAGAVSVTDDALGRGAIMTMEGVGEFVFAATPVQEGSAFEGFRFREFTPATDGLVVWDAVAATPGTWSGRGVLQLAPGSLAAELAGAERVQTTMFWGTYTFSDATFRLPSR